MGRDRERCVLDRLVTRDVEDVTRDTVDVGGHLRDFGLRARGVQP